jgi:hypothetical protein
VEADGTPALHYQWHFNDTNDIPNATNSTFTILDVHLTNGGTYSVTVTNAFGSTLSSNATLTVGPLLDHFGWGPIPSPRFAHAPFPVTIVAQDSTNGVFPYFAGTVQVTSTNGVPVSPAVSADFTNGIWTGALTISQTVSNLVLQATDDSSHTGRANSVDVVNVPVLTATRATNSIQLTWPLAPSGFTLERSFTLSPPAWTAAPGSPISTNGQFLQVVPATGTNQFFRLRFTGP